MIQHLDTISSIGEAWIQVLKTIMSKGKACEYTDNVNIKKNVKEILGLSLTITHPSLPDPIIEQYKDKEEYAWMEANFTQKGPVKKLYNENSYATRLYDYMHQKNQIEWVIQRLKEENQLRSAAITTFEPLTDNMYIPCVSLLDFQVVNNQLCLYVYARALDFGTKAYMNMVMLTQLMNEVANALDIETGEMNLFVKSAHVYESEYERVEKMIQDFQES